MRQRLLDSPREKADAAALHKLWFCQILVGHSCQETAACLDAVSGVLEGVLGARGRLGGSTEILVLCKAMHMVRLGGVTATFQHASKNADWMEAQKSQTGTCARKQLSLPLLVACTVSRRVA